MPTNTKSSTPATTTLTHRIAFFKAIFIQKKFVMFAVASGFLFGLVLFGLSHMPVFTTAAATAMTFLGIDIAVIHTVIIFVLAIMFGINLTLLRVRIVDATTVDLLDKKTIGTTSIASVLGILFSGCASCGLTFASYVGLGSFAAFLPFDGLEMDLLAILLLGFSIWNLSVAATCDIPRTQKGKKTPK